MRENGKCEFGEFHGKFKAKGWALVRRRRAPQT